MRRSVITRLGRYLLTLEEENGRITGILPEDPEQISLVGRIYVGRVKNILKNIQAAFVDVGISQLCYLPLEEWKKYPGTETHGSMLREGDEVLIQIEKDALKTKAPSAVTRLSFAGQYLVLTVGRQGIFFSSKIQDEERKTALNNLLKDFQKDSFFSVIVRTNGSWASDAAVLQEYGFLQDQASHILEIWKTRRCGSLLWEPEPAYISEVFNNRLDSLEEIVTDQREVWEKLEKKLEFLRKSDRNCILPRLRFYEDSYPLYKLYSAETAIDEARREKVWLKSGGFLIIQPTEALVSIDVNTGKYAGHKNLEDTFFRINREAAEEIAVQLRIRNLSGIIIVDFIDMKKEEHKTELLQVFSAALRKDPVKVTLLGYTRLNLVELTRKKIRKPLHEIYTNP